MADIVCLNNDKKPSVEIQKDLVEMLEELLAEAKSGSLQSVAYTAIYLGGDQSEDWAGPTPAFTLLGAIRLLMRAFEDVIVEENQ